MNSWIFIENKDSVGNNLNIIFQYSNEHGFVEGRGLTKQDAVIDALQIVLKDKEPHKI